MNDFIELVKRMEEPRHSGEESPPDGSQSRFQKLTPTNDSKIFGDQSLRQILDWLVQTKEVWAAALTGSSMPPMDVPPDHRTTSTMLGRVEKADAAFDSVLTDVRNRSFWEDTFADALCEPPETFTFGGMFAHVITFNFYRRMLAAGALRDSVVAGPSPVPKGKSTVIGL